MSLSLGDITLRIGYILGCTPKHIIVRPSTWSQDKKLPAIGLDIYDEKTQPVGKITDVIGPVYKPYFKIKPFRPNLSSSSFTSRVGEPLYTLSDSRGKNLSKKGKFPEKRLKDQRHSSNTSLPKKDQKNPRNTIKSSKNKASSPK